jgi:hypothetical protein
MLDEVALRRPEFTEGCKVTLWDGQEWTFPKPKIRLYPVLKPDKTIEVGGGATFGPESEKLLEVLLGGADSDEWGRIKARLEMATRLLLSNYELTADDLTTLIVIENTDESNAIWENLNPVLSGSFPKASSDTCD